MNFEKGRKKLTLLTFGCPINCMFFVCEIYLIFFQVYATNISRDIINCFSQGDAWLGLNRDFCVRLRLIQKKLVWLTDSNDETLI